MFTVFVELFKEMVCPQDKAVVAGLIGGQILFDIGLFGVGI